MEAIKLAGLQPASVFGYFEKLCSMPHGSGNTKIISDYLVSFAREQGIRYIQDELNNVIFFQEGTCGYEDHAPVILQGHMDMVCEKDADCPIDMEKEGLDVTHDGQCVFARGTTLGGDNCIAVAYALALLADKSIPHPPLEVVITVDEETGMFGAAGIDLSMLKGRTLVNLDSEDEGIFTVSCAGGARGTIKLPVQRRAVYGPCVRLTVEGLVHPIKAVVKLLHVFHCRLHPIYEIGVGGAAAVAHVTGKGDLGDQPHHHRFRKDGGRKGDDARSLASLLFVI